MSVRKQVVFGSQDKELKEIADSQENFSAYVKNLMKREAKKTNTIINQKPCKPKVYIDEVNCR